jgi:hypothetical protein
LVHVCLHEPHQDSAAIWKAVVLAHIAGNRSLQKDCSSEATVNQSISSCTFTAPFCCAAATASTPLARGNTSVTMPFTSALTRSSCSAASAGANGPHLQQQNAN